MAPQKKKRRWRMLGPTLVMGALALILYVTAWKRGDGSHLQGVKTALSMVAEILPLLLFAFLAAGLIQVLVPQEVVSRWVGVESGWKGILLGAVAGGLTPGGPYVSLPVAAGLLKAGASVGTCVAFLTGWALWAAVRLPMEVGILGWKLALVRLASTLVFPPLAGFLAQIFFGKVSFF